LIDFLSTLSRATRIFNIMLLNHSTNWFRKILKIFKVFRTTTAAVFNERTTKRREKLTFHLFEKKKLTGSWCCPKLSSSEHRLGEQELEKSSLKGETSRLIT
jgi:hypothetical protein